MSKIKINLQLPYFVPAQYEHHTVATAHLEEQEYFIAFNVA